MREEEFLICTKSTCFAPPASFPHRSGMGTIFIGKWTKNGDYLGKYRGLPPTIMAYIFERKLIKDTYLIIIVCDHSNCESTKKSSILLKDDEDN